MTLNRPVRYVELTTLKHATEDSEKVLRAVHNLFPLGADIPVVKETILKGLFGDPIVSVKLEITNIKSASDFLDHVIKSLNSLDFTNLIDQLPQRIDESKNLYIRFDKQKAYQGKTVLDMHDAIRVKFRLQLPHGSNPIKAMTKYIEEIMMREQ
jgi:RNA binding exosome subunit